MKYVQVQEDELIITRGGRKYAVEVLMRKQNGRCAYCDIALSIKGALGWPTPTIDHIMPRSKGGVSLLENLCVCCKKCNREKGNMSAEDFKQKRRDNATNN